MYTKKREWLPDYYHRLFSYYWKWKKSKEENSSRFYVPRINLFCELFWIQSGWTKGERDTWRKKNFFQLKLGPPLMAILNFFFVLTFNGQTGKCMSIFCAHKIVKVQRFSNVQLFPGNFYLANIWTYLLNLKYLVNS